ncbi:MAG: hypothetical protein ACM31N_04900 [Deltaproteobacteria bacterium]
MKPLKGKWGTTAEVLFVGTFFVVYAFLLLVADPEWLMWAGPVALGAYPVEAAPFVLSAFDPLEALRSASFSLLPGLLALIVLVRIGGRGRGSGIAESKETRTEGKQEIAHGAPAHRKAA